MRSLNRFSPSSALCELDHIDGSARLEALGPKSGFPLMVRVAPAVFCAVLVASCQTARIDAPFDPSAAAYVFEKGSGTIEGEAFLRRDSGTIMTAAGERVFLIPATAYAVAGFEKMFGGDRRARGPEASAGYRVQRSAHGRAANRRFVWRSDKAWFVRDPRKILRRLEGPAALAPR